MQVLEIQSDDPVGIVVIDDHEMVGRAIAETFRREADFVILGVATSVEAGVALAATTHPALVVTDLHLGDGDIVDHLDRIRTAAPGARVLVMTGMDTERTLLQVLRAGANGYVTKLQPLTELIVAARRVAAGDVVFPPAFLQTLLELGGVVEPLCRRGPGLTPREIDVLQLLALGHGTATVASRLNLAVNTIRNHLASAMSKLGTGNRLAAVSEALRLGIISPPTGGRWA